MKMIDLFTDPDWHSDLEGFLKKHEVDQIAGIDADMLAEFLATVATALVRMVQERDRGMPEALSAMERSELAVLRRTNKLQEAMLEQEFNRVGNLEALFRDMTAQRDRALGVVKK